MPSSYARNSIRSAEPPPGPPWDLAVDDAPLAFLDLEMTGLDPSRDRVVEVCLERWRGSVREGEVSTLVSVPAEVAGGAVDVHGIGPEELASAPAFPEILDRVRALLDGAILVAHAAEWDVGFLVKEAERAGALLEIPTWLDTLTLARRAFSLRSYSLDALCTYLEIDRGRAHRAAPDVLAMRRVFARCIEVLAPKSCRDLWEVRIAERHARAEVVAACEAAVEHASPVQVVYRPSRRAPEPMLMVLTDVRTDLDPPRVIGYQLPGRGRRELRADRILRVEPPPGGERDRAS